MARSPPNRGRTRTPSHSRPVNRLNQEGTSQGNGEDVGGTSTTPSTSAGATVDFIVPSSNTRAVAVQDDIQDPNEGEVNERSVLLDKIQCLENQNSRILSLLQDQTNINRQAGNCVRTKVPPHVAVSMIDLCTIRSDNQFICLPWMIFVSRVLFTLQITRVVYLAPKLSACRHVIMKPRNIPGLGFPVNSLCSNIWVG